MLPVRMATIRIRVNGDDGSIVAQNSGVRFVPLNYELTLFRVRSMWDEPQFAPFNYRNTQCGIRNVLLVSFDYPNLYA